MVELREDDLADVVDHVLEAKIVDVGTGFLEVGGHIVAHFRVHLVSV